MGLTLSLDSKAEVDAVSKAAAAHGGTVDINPVQDHGFMYTRDLLDPDGHVWEAREGVRMHRMRGMYSCAIVLSARC